MGVVTKTRKWLSEHDPVGDVTKPIFQKVEDKFRGMKESELGSKFGIKVGPLDYHILDPWIWTSDVMSNMDHPELLLPTPAGAGSLAARVGLKGLAMAPKAIKTAQTLAKSQRVRKLVKPLSKTRIGKTVSRIKGQTGRQAKRLASSPKVRAATEYAAAAGKGASEVAKRSKAAVGRAHRARPSEIIARSPLGKVPGLGKPFMKRGPLKYAPFKSAVGMAETDFLSGQLGPDQRFIWDAVMGDVTSSRHADPSGNSRASQVTGNIQAPAGTDESIFQKALAKAVAEVRPDGPSAPSASKFPGMKDEELSSIELDRIKKLCTKYCSQMEHKAERK